MFPKPDAHDAQRGAKGGAEGAYLNAMLSFDCCQTRGHSLQCVLSTEIIHIMRTNIVIDDELMESALRATGLKTKREAVELGLRTLLLLRQQEEIRRFRGKLNWQGDLDAMRLDK